jgi:hypothetical protein
MNPPDIFYYLSAIGGLFQLASFFLFVITINKHKEPIGKAFSKWQGSLLIFVAFLFLLKLLAQFIGSFPEIAGIVSNSRDLIIGYLHMIFLGIVSISLFAYIDRLKLWAISKWAYIIYLIAFLSTEILIFYNGISVWLNKDLLSFFYYLLFIMSFLFIIAVLGMLFFPKPNRIKES